MMRSPITDHVLALFLTLTYRVYSWFWRYEHICAPLDSRVSSSYIGAHWHGDELLLIRAFSGKGMAIMASRSRDGTLVGRVLSWLGFRVARGSSTRGGAQGLKALIDLLRRDGGLASLAVDGPRGPIFKVKPGVLLLAQQTGRPIIPGAAAASRRIVFKSAWNQCYLPLPFSRCVILYGKPLWVPKELSNQEFESLRLELEHRLIRLKLEAEARFHRYEPLVAERMIPSGV